MKLFVNKGIRRFFWELSAVLILFLLWGLIFSQVILRDFKAQLLTHDYKVAGYLLEQGVSPADVSAVFAAEKSEQELSSGKRLLQTLGYQENIHNRLLPEANSLLSRYRLILVLSVVLFGALILTSFFSYFKRQQSVIERANLSINAFMGGDTTNRIDSEEEGGLSKLLASINGMATSLNAHIEREKHTKEFLKETISDISHQLKTPLAALKMYNEIIQEESANEETVKKFTAKTDNALERMEILIHNLLKIAKLDTGTITMNKRKETIRVLIQEIVSELETRAEQEQKTITLNGSEAAVLYGDRVWLKEGIGNLVKNALDHTEAGGKIEITWQETPAMTKIMVQDNGKGIHPEDIYHIFKRFYRSCFSQDTQGLGLGLSLAKSIVEAHNGTLTVDSSLGKGSVFRLDFLKLTKL